MLSEKVILKKENEINKYLYDMHCHLNEFSNSDLSKIFENKIKVVAVSEELESLRKIMELADVYKGYVIPCGGFHPWILDKMLIDQSDEIIKFIERHDLNCIGEVGIDKRFMKQETFKKQEEIFLKFVNLSKEMDIMINIHSPNAWKEVLEILVKNDVRRAMFHWYTGPIELIEDIAKNNYAISLNVALMLQKKHIDIIKNTPKEHMVLESDGPYNYHGIKLSPLMISELVDFIAKTKNMERDEVINFSAVKSIYLLKS
ncbi:MAG: TatD family hydrolase [Caldisphaera sp.]|jgi:TatD DNase family protein|nr:TatD family hydrolase [Caldisphaera sp.]PMP59510.1 MAG: TatD family deoxyribonuclease [Caldisphaera sp.]